MQQEPAGTEQTLATTDPTFYQQHASAIFTYIYHRLPSRQDAEDIMLEVFVAALLHHNLAGFSLGEQQAWLWKVARNKIADHYRRTLSLTFLPLENALDVAAADLTPEQQVIRREGYERLYRALTRLSPLEQQMIRLRFLGGLRFAHIAEILNKPENTVRALLSRALRRLRTIYLEAERS
ncbi:MAG: sigma-70 family RNA polymerase sigma factor [Chloroflexota bacterium]|nr:sigma-70 family RNA polymerase sigma factor [Chloroflexota bacterium]